MTLGQKLELIFGFFLPVGILILAIILRFVLHEHKPDKSAPREFDRFGARKYRCKCGQHIIQEPSGEWI